MQKKDNNYKLFF